MKNKKSIGRIISDWSMVILLLVLMVFFSIMSPAFLTPLNITNILVQNVHVAVCSTAVFIIMVSGGCDLSIGYQMSVAAVLCTKLLANGTVSVPVAVLLAIVVCSILGSFNGLMTLVLKSNAMIVTLGTMAIFQGISYLISGSKTFHNLPKSFMYIGQGKIGVIPLNVIIMAVLVAIAIFVLTKTSIGRDVYAAGEDPVPGADGRSLCRSIRQRGLIDPIFVAKPNEIPGVLASIVKPGDIVLTQGAGNINMVAKKLAELKLDQDAMKSYEG